MPTERLVIQIDEKGARVVTRNIGGIGGAAEKSSGFVNKLKGALIGIGGALVIRNLVQTADKFTQLQNRIRVVTKDTEELDAVTKELTKTSNETRSSLEATTEVYSRLALSTKQLGLSQERVLNLTKALNQAVILSGAGAQESRAGMIQFAQGMSSGALRGDELRSVLEQLPVVADVIAKELGVTRGELRKMGEQGLITADKIISAFENAAESLGERFGKTVPTVGQRLQVLGNRFIIFIGRLDQSLGATAALGRMIDLLGRNLETIGRLAQTAGLFFSVSFAKKGIGAAIGALKLLRIALLTNPIGILITGLTLGIAALVAFRDEIKLSGDGLATLGDVIAVVFDNAIALLERFVDFAIPIFQEIEKVYKSIFGRNFELSIAGMLRLGAQGLDALIGIFLGAFGAVGAVVDQTFKELKNPFMLLGDFAKLAMNVMISTFELGFNGVIDMINSAIRLLAKPLNFLIDKANQALRALGQSAKQISRIGDEGAIGKVDFSFAKFDVSEPKNAATRIGKAAKDGFIQGFTESNDVLNAVDGILEQAEARALKRREGSNAALERERAARANLKTVPTGGTGTGGHSAAFQQVLTDLDNQARLLQLNNREREIGNDLLTLEQKLLRKGTQVSAEQRQLLENRLKNLQALREQADILQEIRGPQDALVSRTAALNKLFEDGKITLDEYNRALRGIRMQSLQTATTMGAGFERAFLKIQEDVEDLATATENALTSAFSSAEDALAEFVVNGKADFKSLANAIIKDLIRIAIRRATLQAVNLLGGVGTTAGTTGGTGGGGASAGAGVSGGLAAGGPINSGQAMVVGERGPEVFRPTGSGNIIPNSQAGGVTQNVTVIQNIQTPNAESFRRSEGQVQSAALKAGRNAARSLG